MALIRKFSTAFEVWRKAGVAGIRRKIEWKRAVAAQERDYARWLESYGTPTQADLNKLAAKITEFAERPLISILLPVYNVEEKWLRSCLDSVLHQIYPHWELCIADDCSRSPHIRAVLDEYAARDSRVKVFYRDANGHISAASNSALELATGEFTVLLDHDDLVSADALFWVANELNEYPDAAMIYSDEDMIDANGRRYSPNFKPDFSYDLLLSINLVTHLSAYKTELLRSIGGFRLGLEGSQDYDLALRAIEQISAGQIRHIPKTLYHWRAIPGSVALNSEEKPYAHERARDAIRAHLDRSGIKASVTATDRNFHRVKYELADPPLKVSIIVDAPEGSDQIARLSSLTDYRSFEIIAVSGSDTRRAARLNSAAQISTGEICVFVREGAAPLSKGWLEEMARFLAIPEIGAVGGRILAPDHTVLEGGLIIGTSTGVSPAFGGVPIEFPGMTVRNDVVGNFSAVSESCLAVRRIDLDREGGFDEQAFPNSLFSADLCLKLLNRGFRIVLTPYADLMSTGAEPAASPTEPELTCFKKRWPRHMAADPFYNPNLSKRDGKFSIQVGRARAALASRPHTSDDSA